MDTIRNGFTSEDSYHIQHWVRTRRKFPRYVRLLVRTFRDREKRIREMFHGSQDIHWNYGELETLWIHGFL